MERNKHQYNKPLSKTQSKKKKRKKFPNVLFKQEMIKVFENMEDPKNMIGAFLTFFCALRNG